MQKRYKKFLELVKNTKNPSNDPNIKYVQHKLLREVVATIADTVGFSKSPETINFRQKGDLAKLRRIFESKKQTTEES